MESIDRNNYEAFFLDYHEGSLSGEEMSQVIVFLESNEDLKEEFYSFKNITLEDTVLEPTIEMDKTGLYQGPVASNYQDYFIGQVEGTLSSTEMHQVSEFISEFPEKGLELELFKLTKLEPPTIIFDGKSGLKKGGAIIPIFKFAIPAAAAAVIIFFFINTPALKQDYHLKSEGIANVDLIKFDQFNPEFNPIQIVSPEVTPGPGEFVPKEKPPLPLNRLDVKQAAKLSVKSAEVMANLGSQPIIPAVSVKKPEEINLVGKATQYADHKIVGTPKAEATSSPLKLLEKSIEKVTKKETSITKKKTEDRKNFSFKIGKFEFSRSRSSKGNRKKS